MSQRPELKQLRKPTFSLDNEPPYAQTARALYNLGWSISAIARAVNSKYKISVPKACMIIKQLTFNTPVMTFKELFPHIPFYRLVSEEHVLPYQEIIHKRVDPNSPKTPISPYEINMMRTLVLLGWRKNRVATLFKVSAVFVSVHTSDITQWSALECQDFLPTLFNFPVTI